MEKTLKEKAVAVLRSIETGDAEAMAYINAQDYTQHNVVVGDGIEGFAAVMQELKKYPEPAAVNVIRAFQDDNYVFTHTHYNFFGPKVGFDIFRFRDGLIVEHWDNLQDYSPVPNPSGHTTIDGPTEATDPNQTVDNKVLVEHFVTEILMQKNPHKIADYFDGDNFIQHNPAVGDGLSGFAKGMEWMQQNAITMEYRKIHKTLGEGSFVLVVCEGVYGPNGGAPTAFYDLFRVENGKIAEHWDVISAIPPENQWQNENGKFAF